MFIGQRESFLKIKKMLYISASKPLPDQRKKIRGGGFAIFIHPKSIT